MEKLNLREERDFSEKLNATFTFIKQNFKSFFLVMLVLISPLTILQSFYASYVQSYIFENTINIYREIGSIMTIYGVMIVFYLLVHAWMQTIVFSYLKLYLDGKEQITIGNVASLAIKKYSKILGVTLLVGIIVGLATLLLVIPGIYLGIVFTLVPCIVFFEEDPAFEAISRSFKLINEKWWSTFGLLFVIVFIVGIMNLVFAIPQYIITFAAASHGQMPYNSTPYNVSGAITAIGTGLLYPLIYITLAMQYFNLIERRESQGLKYQIDTAANQEKPKNVNEGEF